MIIHTQDIINRRGLNKGGRAQKFVDSEVLRYCDPLVPFDTGFLKGSGTRGTVIGSGVIKYIAPYAKQNYYNNAGNGTQGLNNGGQRGRLWFARMKTRYREAIRNGLQSICRRQ